MSETPDLLDQNRGSGRERKAWVLSWYLIRRFLAGKWRKVLLQRLTEPLHLNFRSFFVALLGSFRAFDLIVRPQYAFSILHAADWARANGHNKMTIIEFGVASGAGLLNMCRIASSVMKATGIEIEVVGFDTGSDMPPPVDYRDHPEVFTVGDFPMHNPATLRGALPPYARLIIGNIADTVGTFLENLSPDSPIGFASIDVDYYSSRRRMRSWYFPVLGKNICQWSFYIWMTSILNPLFLGVANSLRHENLIM
jgi:hypothetical protein